MEKLEHELWAVQAVNAVLGPLAAAILRAFGRPVTDPAHVIPNYLAVIILIVLGLTALSLFVRSRLSVEKPGKLQIVLEDLLGLLFGLLEGTIGSTGRQYIPLVGTLAIFIWICNLAGLVPGLMAPTSSINVTLGCALSAWVYYHFHGIRVQGIGPYLKHFAVPPGSPVWMAPLMLIIEPISHLARVLSLSLRLFGNIFGEELVIVVLASIVPFFVPLPMMFLGLLTATLQAAVFVILTTVYIGGAVASEHHDDHAADAAHH
jgi:F-type H+-transporting ATPase subunit a